jgi:hypothetical protein
MESLPGGTDGANPGTLINVDGVLYGTTATGGGHRPQRLRLRDGVLYKCAPKAMP